MYRPRIIESRAHAQPTISLRCFLVADGAEGDIF